MAFKEDSVSVTCPKCGHAQPVPRAAYSGMCKKCGAHFRLAETLKPVAKPATPAIETKRIICFQCGAALDVSVKAESTICKKCSSHVDLTDYQITATISKNFRTHGRLVIEEKGYVLNTEALIGDGVIKGKLIGKLTARRTLEIYTSARITGTFTAEQLIVPAGNHFRWHDTLSIGGAEIGGELAADIKSEGTIRLKPTARLFGNIQARNFVVESGAVFVGAAKIGKH